MAAARTVDLMRCPRVRAFAERFLKVHAVSWCLGQLPLVVVSIVLMQKDRYRAPKGVSEPGGWYRSKQQLS